MRPELKTKAIELRRRGLTYSEILSQIPIAKSTLALWLREVGLSKKQKQRITQKRIDAGKRGGAIRHSRRIEITKEIQDKAKKEIGKLSKRELWLIGAALYWAEGSKEKDYRPGSGVKFTNSDAEMVRIFIRWLVEICNIQRHDVSFSLIIHENHKSRLVEIRDYWAKTTGFPKEEFTKIYFKQGNPKTNRRNIGSSYFGIVQVRARNSSTLNRKIAGWVNGMIESLRK